MDIKSVEILGQKYKVVVRPPKEMSEFNSNELFGMCFRDLSKIWVNNKLDVEHSYRTLFHEMGHAALYRNGIAFTAALSPDMEEVLVETFASMQYEFLRTFLKTASKGKLVDDIVAIID